MRLSLDRRVGERVRSAAPAWPTVITLALFIVLGLWVADRLDAFRAWADVTSADGRTIRLPDTYGTIDHPFHVARAETLRRALAAGQLPRWVGHHQGGYPAEFYPFGVAGLEVGLWALLLGSLPMAAVHKLAVLFIFLAPGLVYALMARCDHLPLGVGLLALSAQVSIAGWWWSGGFRELVEWGLIANVAAAVANLFVLLFLALYLDRSRPRDAALASLLAACALVTNPRSAVALLVIGAGAAIAVAWTQWLGMRDAKPVARRLALIAVVAGLCAAPQIVSLVRFQGLYYFVRYSGYDDLGAYWRSSIQAVSGPVFALTIAGLLLGLAKPRRVITHAVAITLVLYVAVTAYLSVGSWPGGLIAQLEPTRLMPFQRLLALYLAAVAVADGAAWLASRARLGARWVAPGALLVAAGLVVIVYVVAPPRFVPEGDRGLARVATAATLGVADLREAVESADAVAVPGTAMLILGTTVSWHDQLWAPLWSDRPFFYDDWLWYWQTRHVGPYDPWSAHAYEPARMAKVLSRDYLERHGVGAVVVTSSQRTALAAAAAATSPALRRIRSGIYDVYVVQTPVTIVTFDGANATALDVREQSIRAQGSSQGGTATIRRNWFPRWRATVNGEPAPITQTDDGYMAVPVPPGIATVELRYAVDRWDWVARGACVSGLVTAVGLLLIRGRATDRQRGQERETRGPITPTVRSARR